MGTEPLGLSGLAVDSLGQQMVYHQHLRLVVRLGFEHGYRIVTDDVDCKSSCIPRYLENVYFFRQNACVETENRRNQQKVS